MSKTESCKAGLLIVLSMVFALLCVQNTCRAEGSPERVADVDMATLGNLGLAVENAKLRLEKAQLELRAKYRIAPGDEVATDGTIKRAPPPVTPPAKDKKVKK